MSRTFAVVEVQSDGLALVDVQVGEPHGESEQHQQQQQLELLPDFLYREAQHPRNEPERETDSVRSPPPHRARAQRHSPPRSAASTGPTRSARLGLRRTLTQCHTVTSVWMLVSCCCGFPTRVGNAENARDGYPQLRLFMIFFPPASLCVKPVRKTARIKTSP